jgi:CBS domain-containing protein
VFLKGSGNLLDQLYCDIGERILGDIDFLVPKKDYLITAKILEEVGYSIFVPFYSEIESLKHYPRISKPGYPAVLEIHQLPVTERFQSWFNSDMIVQDKKPVKSLPGSYVLSDNHNVILNFIHSQLDHEGHLYGIVSFRDLYDLYLFSKRTPLTGTIKNIKTREKAIAYFAFVGKAFGLNEKFFPDSNFSAWVFAKKHDLNQGSVFFYHSYRGIVFLVKRVFGGIGQVLQSFYSEEMRRSVINRVTNRKWYRDHFRSYLHFFPPNK